MKNVAQLRQAFLDILDTYDREYNPAPAAGKSVAKHYLSRLFNSQKFFCGAKGRTRSQQFRIAVMANAANEKEYLQSLYHHAIRAFDTSVHSSLANEFLEQIAFEIKFSRMDFTRGGFMASGMHTHIPPVEQNRAFYGRLEGALDNMRVQAQQRSPKQ